MTLPYWMIIIGDFFAIVVVRQLFGGLGTNFLNPALAGRAFLMLSYPVPMTTWVLPGQENWVSIISAADAVTGSTPLSADFMKNGILPDASLADMFIGNVGGCVGEVSAIALLIGGIYLIARKVIRIRIPLAYILTVAVLTLIFLALRASAPSPGCSMRSSAAACSWVPSSWQPTMSPAPTPPRAK